MPHIDDIASPERMKRPGVAMLIVPVMLLAAWLVLTPHHGAPHVAQTPGLAAAR